MGRGRASTSPSPLWGGWPRRGRVGVPRTAASLAHPHPRSLPTRGREAMGRGRASTSPSPLWAFCAQIGPPDRFVPTGSLRSPTRGRVRGGIAMRRLLPPRSTFPENAPAAPMARRPAGSGGCGRRGLTPAGLGPNGSPQMRQGLAPPARPDFSTSLRRAAGTSPEPPRRAASGTARRQWRLSPLPCRASEAQKWEPLLREALQAGAIRPAGTSARRARHPPSDPVPANRSLAIPSSAGAVRGG
jgi:hypothetical protein